MDLVSYCKDKAPYDGDIHVYWLSSKPMGLKLGGLALFIFVCFVIEVLNSFEDDLISK